MLGECIAPAAYFANARGNSAGCSHGSEVKGAELNLRRFGPWTGKGKIFVFESERAIIPPFSRYMSIWSNGRPEEEEGCSEVALVCERADLNQRKGCRAQM